ncbi:MAG: hypothetical protein HYY40_12425 [Bacteroidetes bacterium]|nr:hypothetical protein [Bacteroidota bacterium]
MRIIKTEKQKDNLAKYIYDISKVVFAVAVIGPIAKPESTDKYTLIVGVAFTIIVFIFASIIDSNKFKQ